jgi:hypothetical protein
MSHKLPNEIEGEHPSRLSAKPRVIKQPFDRLGPHFQ